MNLHPEQSAVIPPVVLAVMSRMEPVLRKILKSKQFQEVLRILFLLRSQFNTFWLRHKSKFPISFYQKQPNNVKVLLVWCTLAGTFWILNPTWWVGTRSSRSLLRDGGTSYVPSSLERTVTSHASELYNYNEEFADECSIYANENDIETFTLLELYRTELDKYGEAIRKFQADVVDIRNSKSHAVCKKMDLIKSFPKLELSITKGGGFVEPLLPPLRHPNFCIQTDFDAMDSTYLINDFGEICRNMKQDARTIFIDIGNPLQLDKDKRNKQPSLELIELYGKFGIQFDHIYAFEGDVVQVADAFNIVPDRLLTAYHYMNVVVTPDRNSKGNPWTSVLQRFSQDDFIVVKIDLDDFTTGLALVQQLMDDTNVHLVDQLYFKHRVKMAKARNIDQATMSGTLSDSLDLFTNLRSKGIAAHTWI